MEYRPRMALLRRSRCPHPAKTSTQCILIHQQGNRAPDTLQLLLLSTAGKGINQNHSYVFRHRMYQFGRRQIISEAWNIFFTAGHCGRLIARRHMLQPRQFLAKKPNKNTTRLINNYLYGWECFFVRAWNEDHFLNDSKRKS